MKGFMFLTLALCLLSTSCVTKKKYMEAETGRLEALDYSRSLKQDLEQLQQKTAEQIKQLEQDTAAQGKVIREYRGLLNSNISEHEKLSLALKEKMDQLKDRENTINDLQSMINAQNEKVDMLLSSVKDALMGFSSDELSVTQKNGKVYVAMSDKLLFKSGSAKVDDRGKEALEKLAEVLKKQSEIDVFIEGHTDNKPIKTSQFKDNWDLSVIRATSVVRILTEDYGVNPLQIVPSGRGEFMPVDDKSTDEGRSKKRRTEIIMAPQLDKLLQILQ